MANLRAAIMNAVLMADRIHQEYAMEQVAERGEARVDVFRVLFERNIPLLFRPLGGLLGVFINDPLPGVMVTTKRRLSVQRYTAAHELGHALLNHQPSLDDEGILKRTPFVDRPRYDRQEVEADAFASEFLMPRWLLVHHMKRQQWKNADLNNPVVIYQLSLRIGSSYSATCYALQHHNAIDRSRCQQLLNVPRRDIKKHLAEGVEPETWHGDVWLLTERDAGSLIEGSRNDLIVLKLPEHSDSGYTWRFDELRIAGLNILQDRRISLAQGDEFGGMISRRVTAQPQVIARGNPHLSEVRPWLTAAHPLNTLDLKLDLSGPMEEGLLADERRRWLGAA